MLRAVAGTQLSTSRDAAIWSGIWGTPAVRTEALPPNNLHDLVERDAVLAAILELRGAGGPARWPPICQTGALFPNVAKKSRVAVEIADQAQSGTAGKMMLAARAGRIATMAPWFKTHCVIALRRGTRCRPLKESCSVSARRAPTS